MDVREACKLQKTGKGQWTYGLVTELLRQGASVVCFSDAPLPQEWTALGAKSITFTENGLHWHLRVSSHLKRTKDFDVYISTTSFVVPFLLGSSFPHIPVVHDLIAFRNEPHDRKATLIERLTLKRAMKTAAHVCTISDATTNDLLHKCHFLHPSKVTAIYAGSMCNSVPLSEPDGNTILCIGTLSPRKNQLRLIQAFSQLPEGIRNSHQLVIAGARGWYDDAIIELAKKTPGVVLKDYISAGEYDALMHTATVFALPSLYEGFGLQILDALQRGIPVLTSDRGSLREVVRDAAVLVHPEDVLSIAKGLERLLTDADLRNQLQKSGPEQAKTYTWERTATKALSVLGELKIS